MMPVLGLPPATGAALAGLLFAMADDELVGGYRDAEWTGIAPLLEEDVAMSSIAQDELGHARALFELLAEFLADGRDADALAYDRPPEAYRHARLLDHPRGDWADTIARRYLYETADAVRLAALASCPVAALADLARAMAREERYHLMHVTAWLDRLATHDGEPRRRLLAALERIGPDGASVLAPLPDEDRLVANGILDAPGAELDRRWRAAIAPTLVRLELPPPPPADPARARARRDGSFESLWAEVTSVRRSEPGATW